MAKQLVEASGGADQMKTVMQTMFQGMSASITANMPPEQKRVGEVLLQKMQDRLIAAAPQLLDGAVQVYAQNLTEKELRDNLAWIQSDTGQSMKRKLPQITLQTLQVVMPVIAQVTQGMKQDVLDEACKQANCSVCRVIWGSLRFIDWPVSLWIQARLSRSSFSVRFWA